MIKLESYLVSALSIGFQNFRAFCFSHIWCCSPYRITCPVWCPAFCSSQSISYTKKNTFKNGLWKKLWGSSSNHTRPKNLFSSSQFQKSEDVLVRYQSNMVSGDSMIIGTHCPISLGSCWDSCPVTAFISKFSCIFKEEEISWQHVHRQTHTNTENDIEKL